MGNEQKQIDAKAHPVDALVMHWYCFTFVGKTLEGINGATASTYVGFENKNITIAKIAEQKKQAGVTKDAVLIACIYLGEMTKAEFTA